MGVLTGVLMLNFSNFLVNANFDLVTIYLYIAQRTTIPFIYNPNGNIAKFCHTTRSCCSITNALKNLILTNGHRTPKHLSVPHEGFGPRVM